MNNGKKVLDASSQRYIGSFVAKVAEDDKLELKLETPPIEDIFKEEILSKFEL